MKNFVEVARKIICVGRNYALHAKELGNKVPEKPILFFKPTTAFVQEGSKIVIPDGCGDMHHEVELAVVIGKRASKVSAGDAKVLFQIPDGCGDMHHEVELAVVIGKRASKVSAGDAIMLFQIPDGCGDMHHEVELVVVIGKRASKVSAGDAPGHIAGYALALDMTARDFQNSAKKAGEPWTLAKGFDTACPISDFIEARTLPDPSQGVDIWCRVNGQPRQSGNTKDMIFSIPALIEYTTRYITLEPGDVLLTGTPEGVSQVKSGDLIECGLGDVFSMKFAVA